MRVLAIDPGTVRLGLALSDPSGVVALPLSVLKRRSLGEDLAALRKIADEHQIDRILVGLPRLMDGRLDTAARDAQVFGAEVGNALGRPVEFWDERLTTVAAERYLIAQGRRRQKRRDHVDRVAATLLLQGYLDYQAQRTSGG